MVVSIAASQGEGNNNNDGGGGLVAIEVISTGFGADNSGVNIGKD